VCAGNPPPECPLGLSALSPRPRALGAFRLWAVRKKAQLYWSIYGINLRGPLPEGVVVQGLADDFEAAKAAFKGSWERLSREQLARALAARGARSMQLAGEIFYPAGSLTAQYHRLQTRPAPHTAHLRTCRFVVLATQTPLTRVLPAPHANATCVIMLSCS